jgi:hypothetical protein
MKYCVFFLMIIAIPTVVLADSHLHMIAISPANPDPMAPFRVYVEAELPDQCWTQGPVGDLNFTVLDSYSGSPCPGGFFMYWFLIEREGLPEGHHSIIITEIHDSLRDPGQWEHPIEFTVGDPPVANESLTWSSLKALYR